MFLIKVNRDLHIMTHKLVLDQGIIGMTTIPSIRNATSLEVEVSL